MKATKIPVKYVDTTAYLVRITPDLDAESPREWDNVGTMICSHRNYMLGDEQFDTDDYDGWEDLLKDLKDNRGAALILPLGLYDHSGITMYIGDTHDRWDGGQVGYIFCTQADIDREWNGDRVKAEEYLRGEVEAYDMYLRGEVYGVTITRAVGGEVVDECWGLYGTEGVKDFVENSIPDAERYEAVHVDPYSGSTSEADL